MFRAYGTSPVDMNTPVEPPQTWGLLSINALSNKGSSHTNTNDKLKWKYLLTVLLSTLKTQLHAETHVTAKYIRK